MLREIKEQSKERDSSNSRAQETGRQGGLFIRAPKGDRSNSASGIGMQGDTRRHHHLPAIVPQTQKTSPSDTQRNTRTQ